MNNALKCEHQISQFNQCIKHFKNETNLNVKN